MEKSMGNNSSSENQLKVGINSKAAWLFGVGSIIGSMAWLIHGPMLARAGAPATICSWLFAGLVSIPLALILMELTSMFPTAGGPYYYKYYALKRLIPGTGELLGFLTGWLFWITLVAGLACMSNGLVNLLAAAIWKDSTQSPLYFGPAVIIGLFSFTTLLNLQPVKQAARISNLFTFLKLFMALIFAALVLFSPTSSLARIFISPPDACGKDFFTNVSSVFMIAMAGFSFLEFSGCVASETVNATKTVPRSLLATLLTVTAIYVTMCIAICISAPLVPSTDKSSLVVAGTGLQANCPGICEFIGGSFLGRLFTAAVVASIAGCGFTAILALARISYSMAKTSLFPAQFAELCPKHGIPRYALRFQFFFLCGIGVSANLISRFGIFPDPYTFLGETFGFMYAFVAIIYCFCVVSLRYTDPEMQRDFRIGKKGNGLVWLLSLLTAGFWAYAALACVKPIHQIAGLFIWAIGIPIYMYYRRPQKTIKVQRVSTGVRSRALFKDATSISGSGNATISDADSLDPSIALDVLTV